MADIIKFPLARTAERAGHRHVGPAKIIIFPGVRIERREFHIADRYSQRRLDVNSSAAIATDEEV